MLGITAQVSLYPLRQDDLSPSIDTALESITEHGLEKQTGAMSTLVWGDDEKVFPALVEAFRRAASLGETVMVITVSNACPWPGSSDSKEE
ncbi:hypothetical protein EP232_03450 [bacterium]|nr:MAG: hypothetical protein EP232_03450 [bacterium]